MFQSVITVERVTQVDLVSQRVAELDAHKLSVPSSLDVLLSTAFRVGIRFKGELSPDGVFACEEFIRKKRINALFVNSPFSSPARQIPSPLRLIQMPRSSLASV